MELVTRIYEETRTFPREELYGLATQLRRAAVSIPSNIAEGQARYSHAEFHHFLRNAKGSLAEMETQIQIAISSTLKKKGQRHYCKRPRKSGAYSILCWTR